MEPVKRIHSAAIPLLRPNINTDVIMPSREMRKIDKKGLQTGVFADWRYLAGSREPNPDFIMNDARYSDARIILGGKNFGCGSSREFAVWGLHEYGIRAVVAPSFGGIFMKNCINNGILPVTLPASEIEEIAEASAHGRKIEINLEKKAVKTENATHDFNIDENARHALLNGLDPISETMKLEDKIDRCLSDDRRKRHWLYKKPAR